MGANYTITTRASGASLTAAVYNADHQNHIDNAVPSLFDDYSTNLTEMQVVTDPGELASESLATSLAGELARVRYALQDIKTFYDTSLTRWYQTPTRLSLALGTVATSIPVLNGTVTWNDAAVTFTALKVAVTSTASAAASLLLDLTVGGTSQAKITKAGVMTLLGSLVAPSVGPNSSQVHTLPAVASDTVALLAASQTLTNKTLTSPTLTTPLVGTLVSGSGEAGTPGAGIIRAANAAGTDIAASSLTLTAGLGTGTGNMGTLDFKAALSKGTTGTTAHTASDLLRLGCAQSIHPGTNGALFWLRPATYNDEITAQSGTAAALNFNVIERPTVTARNTSVTTTQSATLAIKGPPSASTNMTITGKSTLWLDSSLATPAGGNAGQCIWFGTTPALGIYYGSGVPTITAPKGSLYLRTDGTSTSTRAYINTDAGTTWTSLTTAA